MDFVTDSTVDIVGTHAQHVPHNLTAHEAPSSTTQKTVSVVPVTTLDVRAEAEDVGVGRDVAAAAEDVGADVGADVDESQYLRRTTKVRSIALSRFA